MANFDLDSNYNPDANIVQVKIGDDKVILETELNEMQKVQRDELRRFVNNHVGDGVYNQGTYSLASGTLTITGEKALVSGELIDISTLTLAGLVNGNSVYLDVWDKEVAFTDTLKKNGNEQESVTVPNYLKDARVGTETSRRLVLAFTLSKTNATPNHRYLKLGDIVSSAFVLTAKELTNTGVYYGTTPPKQTSLLWIDTN